MKHGFVSKMETILEEEKKVKHEDLANEVHYIISLIFVLLLWLFPLIGGRYHL